jgi:hypothetical protein
LDTTDHFFVMVGQVLDSALIGGVLVRLTLSDGGVVEGVPGAPASEGPPGEELDDSGYARWIRLAGTSVDLADVRQATIVRPAAPA